jgi:hypothetical protein
MLLPFFSFLHVQVNKATLYASHFVLRSGLECIFAAHKWVIAMDSQMIAKLEMPSITYVHTAQKETIPVYATLENAFRPEMMKGNLKARTQMVESMYRYFDSNLSESHRAKLFICTLLDPRSNNYNMWQTRK